MADSTAKSNGFVVVPPKAEHEYMKIYLQAVSHDEVDNPVQDTVTATGEDISSMMDFLGQLSLTVKSNGRVISSSKASELGSLDAKAVLGIFEKGAEANLEVSLSVPATMGNEYMHRAGEIDWVLTTEEYIKEETTEVGNTGIFTADNDLVVGVWPVSAAMILGVIASIVTILIRKKRKN